MADTDLIERLREESLRLSGRSIDRGCVDSGIAANLADEAATAFTEQAARIAKLEAELIQSRNFWSDELSASRAECEVLRAALSEAQKTMRNCQGAIESNQVEDKDVRRQLIRGRSAIAAALSRKETGDAA